MSAERLQKVLASAGVASRRDCEELISGGRVTVNGQVMTELGARVDPEQDEIAVDGKVIGQPEQRTYLMLHKPVGVVATADDPQGRPTVVELVDQAARLFPVGRLDTDSEGLLLLTDDGELTHRLTHPSFEVEKEYRVLLDRTPDADALRQWREGVMLEGERTAPAWVEVLDSSDGGVWVRVVLREGRKRQIREVAKLLGYEVLRLIRVREDTLTLGDLPAGESRPLTAQEITALKAHTVVATPRAPASRAARASRRSDDAGDDERQPQESRSGERAPRARTPYGRGEETERPRGSTRDEGGFRGGREGGRRDEGGFRGGRDNEGFSGRDDRRGNRDYGSNSRRDEGGFRDRRDDRASGGRDFGSRRDEGGFRGGRDFSNDRRDYGNDRRESNSRRDEGGFRDRSAPPRDYNSGPRRDERGFGGSRDEGGSRERREYGNDRRESGFRRDEGGFRERRDYGNDRRESSGRRDEGGFRERSSAPRDFTTRRDDRGSSNRDYSNRRDTGSNFRDRREYGNDRRDSGPRRDEGNYRDRSPSSGRDYTNRRDEGGFRGREYGNDRRESGFRRNEGGFRDRRDERPSGDRPYNNRRDAGSGRDYGAPRRDDRQGNDRQDFRQNNRYENNAGDRSARGTGAPNRRNDAQSSDENRRSPRAAQQEPAAGPGRAWRERQEEEAQQRKARVAGGARVARGNFRSRIAGRPAFPVRSRSNRSEGGSGEEE